jgi:hypothetical protein
MVSQDRGIYRFQINPSKRYFKYKRHIIGLLIIIAILIGGKIATSDFDIDIVFTKYGFITKHDLIPGEAGDELYKHYIDTYNFYCAIPAAYTAGGSYGGANRLGLKSPDGKTLLFIGAVPNKLNLSAKELMKQYIAEFGGDKADYYAHGESWYVVSKTNANIFYYRKCFVDSSMILWFEFNVKAGSKEPLKAYIDYIEDNFKMTRTGYYALLRQAVVKVFSTSNRH